MLRKSAPLPRNEEVRLFVPDSAVAPSVIDWRALTSFTSTRESVTRQCWVYAPNKAHANPPWDIAERQKHLARLPTARGLQPGDILMGTNMTSSVRSGLPAAVCSMHNRLLAAAGESLDEVGGHFTPIIWFPPGVCGERDKGLRAALIAWAAAFMKNPWMSVGERRVNGGRTAQCREMGLRFRSRITGPGLT